MGEVERLVWVDVTEQVTYANGDQTQYINFTFRCRYVSGEPHPADGENVEAAFFVADALPPWRAATRPPSPPSSPTPPSAASARCRSPEPDGSLSFFRTPPASEIRLPHQGVHHRGAVGEPFYLAQCVGLDAPERPSSFMPHRWSRASATTRKRLACRVTMRARSRATLAARHLAKPRAASGEASSARSASTPARAGRRC